MYVSCSVSNENAATTSSINDYHIATLRLAKMQDQYSLNCIDGHFQDGAGSMLQLFLHLNAVNISLMHVSKPIAT
jgi:hypothetical protein